MEDVFAAACNIADCTRRATHWDTVTPPGKSPEMPIPLCADHDVSHIITTCAS